MYESGIREKYFIMFMERTNNLQTEGHKKLKLIAISGDSEEPISPCGICRQFIREFGPNVPVFMFNLDGSKFIKVFLQDLLPLSFGPENLGIEPALQ